MKTLLSELAERSAHMDAEFLLRADFKAIADLIARKTEETHALEFKRKTLATEIDLQKEDRRLLGEVLSGFANATGGH